MKFKILLIVFLVVSILLVLKFGVVNQKNTESTKESINTTQINDKITEYTTLYNTIHTNIKSFIYIGVFVDVNVNDKIKPLVTESFYAKHTNKTYMDLDKISTKFEILNYGLYLDLNNNYYSVAVVQVGVSYYVITINFDNNNKISDITRREL